MAFVKDKWLDSKERNRRIKQLRPKARQLAKKAAKHELGDDDKTTLMALDAEIKRLEAIERSEQDVAYFAYRYFSDEYNEGNSAGNIIRNDEDGTPHERLEDIAPIHRDFYEVCEKVAHKNRNGNYVIASPRGHAKTQIFSVILAIHQVVFRKRHYVLLLSETDALSKKIVASIADQLKYNERLRKDFGELLYTKALKNRKDADEGFITTTNVLVESSSAGKSLRGKTHGSGHRPDLIILDDVSSNANEATDKLRQQLIDWFNTTVEPLGGKNAAMIFVGTMVSATGLLRHLLDRRDFESVFHQAVIKGPDNPQLWSDYLHLYKTEPDFEKVEEFFQTKQEEMNQGVRLAWPARWTYRDLMHKKANNGGKAFASEYMNDTLQDDEAVFKPDDYEYYDFLHGGSVTQLRYKDDYIGLHHLDIVGAWDIAMGGTHRSALNAFVTLGRHKETGLVFILDVYESRQIPSEFMKEIIERMRIYKHYAVYVEGIGAYSEFHRQLQAEASRQGLYSTKINLIKSHGQKSKEQRIEALEPAFANKALILNDSFPELINELRHYPHGMVDVLDALTMAFEHA